MRNLKLRRQFIEWFPTGQLKWPFSSTFPFLMEGKALWGTLLFPIAVSTGPPWWIDNLKTMALETGVDSTIGIKFTVYELALWSSLILFCVLLASALYLLFRTKRSMKMKKHIHDIVHFARDQQTAAYQGHDSGEFPGIKYLSEALCGKLQMYFEAQIPTARPQIAIRLLVEKKYVTVGRSGGFSKGRVDTTEPLLPDDGLAKLLRSKKTNGGVFVINDIEKATEAGSYKKQSNDDFYKDDYKTMMVAPINGWDGKEQAMIGMLFVTSKRKFVFKEKHVDAAAFVADVCASLYATVVNEAFVSS